jgi:hypothetical protein
MIRDVLLQIPDSDFFHPVSRKKAQGPRSGSATLVYALPLLFFLCVRALESLKIMDYSLLVGIHNIDQAVAGGGGEWCSNSSPPVSCSMPYC